MTFGRDAVIPLCYRMSSRIQVIPMIPNNTHCTNTSSTNLPCKCTYTWYQCCCIDQCWYPILVTASVHPHLQANNSKYTRWSCCTTEPPHSWLEEKSEAKYANQTHRHQIAFPKRFWTLFRSWLVNFNSFGGWLPPLASLSPPSTLNYDVVDCGKTQRALVETDPRSNATAAQAHACGFVAISSFFFFF